MATREVTTSLDRATGAPTLSVAQNYRRPLAIVTSLFFMWGFLTCLNDSF
jgi:MFS transporter, FHS family, L-fucose permease